MICVSGKLEHTFRNDLKAVGDEAGVERQIKHTHTTPHDLTSHI